MKHNFDKDVLLMPATRRNTRRIIIFSGTLEIYMSNLKYNFKMKLEQDDCTKFPKHLTFLSASA